MQETLKVRQKANVAVLLDTKGPEVRTGMNLNNDMIDLEKGQLLEISTFSH